MAYTINKTAPLHTFVYNPCFWVVGSNNVAQDNFRYICDIYISGQTFAGNNYIRLKVPADPIYSKGVFNPNGILERYVTYDLSIASSGTEQVKQASNSFIQYQLKFGEEYGPSSAVVEYPDLATSGAIFYAHNGVVDHNDYIDFIATSGSQYLNGASTDKRFLTNIPHSHTSSKPHIQIRTNENFWLQMINDSAVLNSTRVHYESYDSDFNSILNTLIVQNNYSALGNVADHRIIVPAGWNIDDILPGDVISGTIPFVNHNSVYFWRLWMTDASNNRVSEIISFAKETSCATGDAYRLHFQNDYGAFDSFTFTCANKFDADIKERKKYAKPPGKFISNNNFMYESGDRLDIVFYTEIKDTITLNSNWVDEDTMFWLEELVTSPVIFVEDGTYSRQQSTVSLSPVSVIDTKFTRKQRSSEKLFNLQVKIQPTYNRYRQRA